MAGVWGGAIICLINGRLVEFGEFGEQTTGFIPF